MVEQERLDRLRATMRRDGVEAVLTADPLDVLYATGVRNMTIFSMMGPSRFALVTPTTVTLWEYAGSEHLADGSVADEVLAAPSVSPVFDPDYRRGVGEFADQVLQRLPAGCRHLAVERFDIDVTDALRQQGLELSNATEVFVAARLIKTPGEIELMWASVEATIAAVDVFRTALQPGRTEVEIWAEFHRALVAANGEYVSTRLAQSGPRTFPYFQEASDRIVGTGDLFCLDTDAIGPASYAADFSRTFLCGDVEPTPVQRNLHGLALEQLHHNAGRLEPGRSFAEFAATAWTPPERYEPWGYSCLAHGLGLCGEHPYIPVGAQAATFPGSFEPGMVICVESYIGSEVEGQGVKLEDQYLLTDDGAVLMSDNAHGLTP